MRPLFKNNALSIVFFGLFFFFTNGPVRDSGGKAAAKRSSESKSFEEEEVDREPDASIFVRQYGSPQSKPVDAPDSETGSA